MPLRIVVGRANAGKTGWILRWTLEALASGVAPSLIVPNLADVRRMQIELSGKAPLGIRVTTAAAFAEELWLLHGDGRQLVGDATRSAVVRKILAARVPESLALSARSPGFERLMVKSAEQSTLANSGADETIAAAESLVVRLLGAYREELGRLGLIEPRWIGPLLADSPPDCGFVGALRFTTYSSAQMDLLRSLSGRNTVCMAVTWEEGFVPTAANETIVAELLKNADVVQVAEEPPSLSELQLLADGLYGGASSLKPTGQVGLGEARGREAEAALVARLAGSAVRGGVSAERVAVLFPQLEPRRALLRNALAAEGLEADFDCPTAVGATSFGRALMALLSIALGRGARSQALEFLQGPFSDADEVAALAADRTWRMRRQTDDSARILAGLARFGGATGRAATLCRELARTPLDEGTAEKWQELADGLISTAALFNSRDVSGEDAGAHRSVTRAVAQMASIQGHPFGAADVLDALPALRCSVSSEETAGRIQVIQASRVGARRFDEVIVGGLTQKETPGATRETFASEIGSLVSGRAREDAESLASLEFYTLVTRARMRLTLVRQTVSSEGVMQVASPLLDEVLDAYRDPATVQGHRDLDGTWASPLKTDHCEDARAFALVFTQGRREQRVLPETLVPATRRVDHGTLDAELAARSVSERVYSATELETYLECPYSWFYSRVLRPEDIDSELDAAALGSRAHRLISDFYEVLRGEGIERVTLATLPAALKLFERSAEQSEGKMAPALGLGEEIDVGRARLWARHVVEDDATLLCDHVPSGHEVVFGKEARFEFAGVPMAGRIDRIDVGPAGIVVSDYKSARDVGKLVRPGPGSSIQHLIYAAAAANVLGQPVQASVYRSLRTRRLRGFWRSELLESLPREACAKDVIDEDAFSALIASAEAQVTLAVEGIKAGRIPRQRRSAASCMYCALNKICEGGRS